MRHIYMSEWLRLEQTDLTALRRQILFPPRDADPGLEVANLPDSEIICGCNGVRKGDIVQRDSRRTASSRPLAG